MQALRRAGTSLAVEKCATLNNNASRDRDLPCFGGYGSWGPRACPWGSIEHNIEILLRFLIGYDMRMNHCWQFKRSEQEDDSDLSSEDVNTNRIY